MAISKCYKEINIYLESKTPGNIPESKDKINGSDKNQMVLVTRQSGLRI